MASRIFFCETCQGRGKIILKGDDHVVEDITCCPICASDISEEDEVDDD